MNLFCTRYFQNYNENDYEILGQKNSSFLSQNMFQLAFNNFFFVFTTTANLFGAEIQVSNIQPSSQYYEVISESIYKELAMLSVIYAEGRFLIGVLTVVWASAEMRS